MAALTVHNDILAIFSNTYNFVINTKTKHYQHLQTFPDTIPSKLPQDQYFGLITFCSTFSDDGQWYAIADQKTLTVWSVHSFTCFCTKTLERAASKIIFTPSNQSIIVADKTGDVYLYSLNDNKPKGTLLLGHLSILLDVLVTSDEKYIITCDRDEKIRVSHFPNAYNIKCYCLGHTEFVTKIALLNNTLLSCSGDGTIKFWSFLDGIEYYSYSISNDIQHDADNSDQCLITNLSTLSLDECAIICLSIHKHDGILVYKSNFRDFRVELIQKIVCKEPLNFTLSDRLLWILTCSDSSILDAWSWTGNTFNECQERDASDVTNIVKKECFNLSEAPYIDLSILYKKYLMQEEKRKKIKLQ